MPPMVSAMTWPARSTASAPLMVTMWRFLAMSSGEFTSATGRKRTSSVLVQPLVQLGHAGGERGDRVAVEAAALAVGHLARPGAGASSPVVNISECTPKSPSGPSASSLATWLGMPPMPVCTRAAVGA